MSLGEPLGDPPAGTPSEPPSDPALSDPALTDQEWDAAFEWSDRLAALPRDAQRAELERAQLSAAARGMVELELRLGAPPDDPDAERRGARIGAHLELRRHLRDGGSGEVHLGIHRVGERHLPVAVKLLRLARRPEQCEAQRSAWLREQELLREFSASGFLPPLVEAGEHAFPDGGQFLYLCTEYKHGLDLDRWCREHQLGLAERLALFLQLCEGIAAIHGHGLIHGDLKPANVQVQLESGVPRPWILDLGLCAVQGHGLPGAGIGTPGYMSPEQIRGETARIREATDIYALGAMLFELLEQEPWLERGAHTSAEELWRAACERPPAELRRLAPGPLRASLEQALRRATALAPEQRFAQVSALQLALREALTLARAVPASPPQPGRPTAEADPSLAKALSPSLGRAFGQSLGPEAGEERKYVTALFADLGEPPAGADPEEMSARLQPELAALSAIAQAHGGTVAHLSADGALALFGAPLAQEDHALQACLAALRMQGERRAGGAEALRIGLHSGEVLVRGGSAGAPPDYGAAGEPPLRARRLASAARPGEIRLTAPTLRLVEGHVAVRALPATASPGAPAAELFELLDQAPVQASWSVRASRRLTPFVEREVELEALLAVLRDAAARGEPRFVEIVGEPGMGKSRLLHELAERAQTQGWAARAAAAHSRDRWGSLSTLGRLLRSALGSEPSASPDELGARLEQRAAALLGASAAAHGAALRSVLELPAGPEWDQLEPSVRRRRTVAALAALAQAAASRRPLLLVVDDLMWADLQTLGVLRQWIGALRGPITLAVASRPEGAPGWQIPGGARLHLRPLSERAGRAVLDVLLGEHPSLEQLKRSVGEQAAGTPLFLEEWVRSLRDQELLAGEPGAYRLEQVGAAPSVPASVQAVIASRVDRLPAELKAQLQGAANIGRLFSAELLAALQEPGAADCRGALDELAERGFLDAEPARGDGAYGFAHALIQQVVYHSIPRARRRQTHARIARALERLHAERLSEQYAELAEHAFLGELWDSAAQYLLGACIAAQHRSAHRELVALCESALATLARMPAQPEVQRRAIDLRIVLSTALVPVGEPARLEEVLAGAEAAALASGDPRRQASVHVQRSLTAWIGGEYARSLEQGEKASALAREFGTRHRTYLAARYMSGQAQNALGALRASIAALCEVTEAYSGPREADRTGWTGCPSALALTYILDCCVLLGLEDESAHWAERGSALAERLGHPFSQAMIHYSVAGWLLWQGRAREAAELLEHSLRRCTEHDVRTMTPGTAARLALARVHLGELELAEQVLAPVLAPQMLRLTAQCTWLEIYRSAGELELARGEPARALEHARRWQALCRDSSARASLALALELTARCGAPERPALLREAQELARELELAPLLARLLSAAPAPAAEPRPAGARSGSCPGAP